MGLITALKEIRIIMASIVQSIHMSAKASVAKTESLKRQRSVKSVSRTSNVTFASSEETVDRRHAMSLFAGAAALTAAKPSFAAYGDSANVFWRRFQHVGLHPVRRQRVRVFAPVQVQSVQGETVPGHGLVFRG